MKARSLYTSFLGWIVFILRQAGVTFLHDLHILSLGTWDITEESELLKFKAQCSWSLSPPVKMHWLASVWLVGDSVIFVSTLSKRVIIVVSIITLWVVHRELPNGQLQGRNLVSQLSDWQASPPSFPPVFLILGLLCFPYIQSLIVFRRHTWPMIGTKSR